MGVPLYITSFYLAVFKILSLLLTFDILIIICFGVDLFEFVSFGFCGLLRFGYSRLGKFLAIMSSSFLPFVSFFSFWNPYNMYIILLDGFPRCLKLCSLFKNSFCFCFSVWVSFIALSCKSLILSSVLSSLLLNQCIFLLHCCSLQLCDFSLVFLIFPLCLLRFSPCSSILFLSSVGICMTITLTSLSGRLLTFLLLRSFC